jgi:hypothetical protein
MRDLANRLIAHETRESMPSGAKPPAAFPGCEKLRRPLAALLGNCGFRVLLSRALALATAEIPRLRAVRVKADGSLEGLAELHAQLDPGELHEGGVVLLAQLLGLLVTFIGEKLTLSLMSKVWTGMSLDDLNLGKGDNNEENQ